MLTKRALLASSARTLRLRVHHLVFSLLSSRKRRIAALGLRLATCCASPASLAEPCEMESLAVRAHTGHLCVSVGLLAVLHLLCTRDELNLDFSVLPWHSMAAVRRQVLLSSCTSLSVSVPPDPSSPKDLHALSFCEKCVLTSSHSVPSSCGSVQSARIAYSCFPRPRFELGLSSCFPQVSAKTRAPRSSVTKKSTLARRHHLCRHHSARQRSSCCGVFNDSALGASHRCCKFVASATS